MVGDYRVSSNETVTDHLNKLLILKELDSMVDFARASNQLALIFKLYTMGRPASTDELACDLAETKKSILDSIRKLEKKNLVLKIERDGKTYVELSEDGRRFVIKLLELLRPGYIEDTNILDVPVRLNIVKEILVSYNVLRLLIKIGLTPRCNMSAKDVEKFIGDPKATKIILESFTRNPTRLFRIANSGGVQYVYVDKAGYDILKRTSFYKLYSSSRVYRFLTSVYKTPFVGELTAKINISISTLTVFLLVVVAFVNIHFIIPALIVVIAQLCLNFYLYKFVFSRE